MKMQNFTPIDSNWLKEVIRFCKPNSVTNFDITFKNTKHGICGRAYWNGCDYHSTNAPLIVIRIGTIVDNYPKRIDCNYGKKRGYIPYLAFDQEERIVQVIAHELRHLWQSKVKKGYRVWGARGRFSERDADAYGIRKVREWRQKHMEELW